MYRLYITLNKIATVNESVSTRILWNGALWRDFNIPSYRISSRDQYIPYYFNIIYHHFTIAKRGSSISWNWRNRVLYAYWYIRAILLANRILPTAATAFSHCFAAGERGLISCALANRKVRFRHVEGPFPRRFTVRSEISVRDVFPW